VTVLEEADEDEEGVEEDRSKKFDGIGEEPSKREEERVCVAEEEAEDEEETDEPPEKDRE
jgi:hypothetical protein